MIRPETEAWREKVKKARGTLFFRQMFFTLKLTRVTSGHGNNITEQKEGVGEAFFAGARKGELKWDFGQRSLKSVSGQPPG